MVVAAIALRLYFYTFSGNITGFFHIGSNLPLSPYLQGQDVLIHPTGGYDGQMFLSLALDPGLQHQGSIAALDNPPYRYHRILYPLLGYLLGFGQPQLIPYALVAINCLAIALIVFLIGLTLQQADQSASQSLFVLAVPGVWLTLALSTADLLSALCLVAAIYYYRTAKPTQTALMVALACLSREVMLLVWAAFLFTSAWEKRWQQVKSLCWAWMPLAVWIAYVASRQLDRPNMLEIKGFDAFLAGIWQKFLFLHQLGPTIGTIYEAFSFGLLLIVLMTTIFLVRDRWRDNRIIFTNVTLYGLLLTVSSMGILMFHQGYNRVFIGVYFLLLLTVGSTRPAAKIIVMTLSSLVSAKYLIDLLI